MGQLEGSGTVTSAPSLSLSFAVVRSRAWLSLSVKLIGDQKARLFLNRACCDRIHRREHDLYEIDHKFYRRFVIDRHSGARAGYFIRLARWSQLEPFLRTIDGRWGGVSILEYENSEINS